MRSKAPGRGDVVWVTMATQVGHEQAGRRPAVVLSPRSYNDKVGMALLCPITSNRKSYPFEVELPRDLPVSGVILVDQIRSLDWRARDAEFICTLPKEVTDEVLSKLALLTSDEN